MLQVVVHVHGDAALAARAVDEELDEVKHCNVPVCFVRLDPVVDKRLQNKGAYVHFQSGHHDIKITEVLHKHGALVS